MCMYFFETARNKCIGVSGLKLPMWDIWKAEQDRDLLSSSARAPLLYSPRPQVPRSLLRAQLR